MRRPLVALSLLTLAALSETVAAPASAKTFIAADRAFHVRYPKELENPNPSDPNKVPLVILLHGVTANATLQESYFKLANLVDTKHFVYAYLDGTRNGVGVQFWNASTVCCQFVGVGGAPIDDVGYINAVIDKMSATYPIDPKRIFVVAHSNGGFMAHRFACESTRVAAIVSLAGALPYDASHCPGNGRVAVLQIHGTKDEVVPYNGGTPVLSQLVGVPLPVLRVTSARQTVDRWATRNGCNPAPQPGGTLDLESTSSGVDTDILRFNCPTSAGVELWSIANAPHIPKFYYDSPGLPSAPNGGKSFPERIYEWLLLHPKP